MSERFKYNVERWWPYVGAVASAALYQFADNRFGPELAVEVRGLTGDIVSVLGVLIGFLATMTALFFALPDRPFINRVSERGGLTQLVGYIKAAIGWAALTLVLGLALKAVDTSVSASDLKWATLIWVGLVALSFATFMRSALLVGNLLSRTLKTHGQQNDDIY